MNKVAIIMGSKSDMPTMQNCVDTLNEFGIKITSHVTELGGVQSDVSELSFEEVVKKTNITKTKLRCADKKAEKAMCALIDEAKLDGDTLGGVIEVIAKGVPCGVGSYSQWDKRLDGGIARAMMSVQAVKAVSIGDGIENASKPGSLVHDEIAYSKKDTKFTRPTNRAGGIEGGIANGEDIEIKVYMKPIATLMDPLPTVDLKTKKKAKASCERSDVTAVPACGIVCEAALAIELASAFMDKFGHDSIPEIKNNFLSYKLYLQNM